MRTSHETLWSETVWFLIFIMSSYGLEMSTVVSISNWTLPDDKLAITCSVSILPSKDAFSIHLICPLVDSASCYVNCVSQCIRDSEGCNNVALRNAFYSCNYIRNDQHNKIDIYYQLNKKHINTGGQWLCEYGSVRSPAIYVSKYIQTFIPVVKSTFSTSTELFKPRAVVRSTTTGHSLLQYIDMKVVTIILSILVVSIIINVVLITVVCVTRKKFLHRIHKTKRKETEKEPTETTSMLTRSSTHQHILNRSNCSRTPSLDSPSFRESIATYLPEGSTVVSTTVPTTEPCSYYVDVYGRIIGILHAVGNFPNEIVDTTSHHSSGEMSSNFIPLIHGNVMMPQRVPPYVTSWSHLTPQHQESFSSTRACSSQQQIYADSNDESGLGSQSFNNSAKQKNGSFSGGSDKVDLIHDCNQNIKNLARPSLAIQ